MRKSIFVIGLILFGIYLATVFLLGYPLVIDLSKQEIDQNELKYEKGDTVRPFERLNFEDGEWEAYLFISQNDVDKLTKRIPKSKLLKTTDQSLLVKMKKDWIFQFTGEDVATAESSIVIFNNGVKKFQSGIILEDSLQGLQNNQFGWIENSKMIEDCMHFKKFIYPILILQ